MPPKKRAHSRHTNTQRPSKRTRSSDHSEVPPEVAIAPQHHRASQNLISVDLQAMSASIAATVSQAVQDALGAAGARKTLKTLDRPHPLFLIQVQVQSPQWIRWRRKSQLSQGQVLIVQAPPAALFQYSYRAWA